MKCGGKERGHEGEKSQTKPNDLTIELPDGTRVPPSPLP